MRAAFRPPHLLALAKALADNRVDGTLHKPGGDTLAVASPLGIVGDHARVAADVDLELVGSLPQRLDTRIVRLDVFQVHDKSRDRTPSVMEVAVPQVALDLAQEAVCGSSFIRIVMAQSLDVLAHDGDAHGDVEPIQ